jgi:uncharacterized membrane protein
MPYCVKCGTPVDATHQFCGKCGASQPNSRPEGFQSPFLDTVTSRNAALLCYIPWIGWIASIVVLASERFRPEPRVRFHAFQGLYLFAAWLMVEWVISPVLSYPGYSVGTTYFGISYYRTASHILQLVIVAAWVFMLVKVSQDQDYRLPILGELADRSVSEQRS